ncbi:hypothetical protein B296_00007031, partial [Ensete ventricosum]
MSNTSPHTSSFCVGICVSMWIWLSQLRRGWEVDVIFSSLEDRPTEIVRLMAGPRGYGCDKGREEGDGLVSCGMQARKGGDDMTAESGGSMLGCRDWIINDVR